jgi:hypothetical protein
MMDKLPSTSAASGGPFRDYLVNFHGGFCSTNQWYISASRGAYGVDPSYESGI